MKLVKKLLGLAVTLAALCVAVLGVLVILDERSRRRYIRVEPAADE